jgi:hypothetical protein
VSTIDAATSTLLSSHDLSECSEGDT